MKRSSRHKCSTTKCWCAEVEKLTGMYKELKAARKKVTATNNAAARCSGLLRANSETKLFEEDSSACKSTMSMIQAQRQNTHEAMVALKKSNELLVRQEEEICQTDKEIAELLKQIGGAAEKSNQNVAMEECEKEVDADEAAWNEAVASECRDLDLLQRKMKKLWCGLEARKSKRNSDKELKQKQKKMDTKLLLNAVTRVEQCLEESKALIESTTCH